MIRPTLRALILGLLAFAACAALVLLVEGLNWAALLPFAGLGLLILLDGNQLPRISDLEARLDSVPYVETGMEVSARLTLEGRKALPKHMALKMQVEGDSLELDMGERGETQ